MNTTEQGHIDVARHGSVSVITLSRPGNGNRITREMAEQAAAAFESARRDRAVSGCVLTGHGDTFCLGGDYRGAGTTTIGRLEFARAFNDLAQAMKRLGKPLVAAINGDAHAGGFSLVTVCDMAVIAETATLGLPEIAHGLFPFLALAIVKDSLPKKVLFDMVYRARLLDATQAKNLYLVNEVVASSTVLAQAIALARCTESYNPDIVSLGRDLYYNTECSNPLEAIEQSRFALAAALKALEESS
jgi:enoyl-CoA hydratase/carnithine racemase